jgi:hypothetical protein
VGTDNCSGSTTEQTAGLASGSTFPVGTTTNTFKVTDASGNTAECSFTVTVNDTEDPSITCPSNITLSACTETASWSAPAANDNCPGATVEQTAGPASGSSFANGSTTTISYKTTDASGNTATCSFTVSRVAALTATCTTNNNVLYFGYSGDQSATIRVTPSGGVGPYTVSITMDRSLKCNQITNAGDELWSGAIASSYQCPTSGGLSTAPVSVGTNLAAGTTYSVNVTLMASANIIATVTDANGCTYTCTLPVYAEDARCFGGNSSVAKVQLCHKTGSATNPCVTICVDESAVAAHLAHGDFFGKCNNACMPSVVNTESSGRIQNQVIAEAVQSTELQITAFPNPSENQFTVILKGGTSEKVNIVVYDAVGRIVKRLVNADPYSQIRFGNELKVGVYIVEVRQGASRKTVKVVKQ